MTAASSTWRGEAPVLWGATPEAFALGEVERHELVLGAGPGAEDPVPAGGSVLRVARRIAAAVAGLGLASPSRG